jgi:hypothetical protein
MQPLFNSFLYGTIIGFVVAAILGFIGATLRGVFTAIFDYRP